MLSLQTFQYLPWTNFILITKKTTLNNILVNKGPSTLFKLKKRIHTFQTIFSPIIVTISIKICKDVLLQPVNNWCFVLYKLFSIMYRELQGKHGVYQISWDSLSIQYILLCTTNALMTATNGA